MFLSITDLSTSLYPEVRDLLARYSETVVLEHCATAESTVLSFLAARYDIAPELAKTGTERHKLLLSIARDIAIYELYQLAETLPAKVVKRHDDARALLRDMAKGLVVLPAVPPAPVSETPSGADSIGYGSRRRRASLVEDFVEKPPIA
jgi:phage gp36-like protein